MNLTKIFVGVDLLFSTVAIFGFGWFYYQTCTWDARISTVEKIVQNKPSIERDSLIRVLELKDIKEDTYINQFDQVSNWFILFVTLIFAVAVLIQFTAHEIRARNIENKYQKQKLENEKHIKDVEERFKKAEINALRERSRISDLTSTFNSDKGEYGSAVFSDFGRIKALLEISKAEGMVVRNQDVLFAIKTCLRNLEQAYNKIDGNTVSLFSLYLFANDAIRYFPGIYADVEREAQKEINKILEISEDVVKKLNEETERHQANRAKRPITPPNK